MTILLWNSGTWRTNQDLHSAICKHLSRRPSNLPSSEFRLPRGSVSGVRSQDSSGPSTVPCVVARLTMENYLRALVGGGGMPRRCPTHGDFPLELEAQLAEARVRRRRLQGRVRDYERRLMQQRRAAAAHQMQVSLPLCEIFMSSRSRPPVTSNLEVPT